MAYLYGLSVQCYARPSIVNTSYDRCLQAMQVRGQE